jgi:hypothetical protein
VKHCPRCASRLRKIGPPARHGAFLDQLLDCAACDWCGVDTQCIDDRPATFTAQQLTLPLETPTL